MDKRWKAVEEVPPQYLREIAFGNLKGKSDISPQWRVKAMTEIYGLQGEGWTWKETHREILECKNGEVMCFVTGEVRYKKEDGTWSEPVEGNGGNKLIALANGQPKPNDEGWKMATTDAFGTALKGIGFASKIYEGSFDGSKYNDKGDATREIVELIGLEGRARLLECFPEKVLSWYDSNYTPIANTPLAEFEMVKTVCQNCYIGTLQAEVGKCIDKLIEINGDSFEAKNSTKKHLGTDDFTTCTNAEALEAFKNHLIEKIKTKQEKKEDE